MISICNSKCVTRLGNICFSRITAVEWLAILLCVWGSLLQILAQRQAVLSGIFHGFAQSL
jgi:hypothetical protein